MVFISLVLATTLTGSGDPVPAPIQYRIEQQVETLIDLSVFGQGEQTQTQSFTWFTTVSLSDSAGGHLLHVILDSIQADLGIAQVAPASYDSARGIEFHGFLDDWGRLNSLTAPTNGGLFSGLFEAQVKSLFPRVKPNAREGESWTDTLMIDTKTPQGTMNVVTITAFQLGGLETQAGAQAIRVDASFTMTTMGKLQTPAGSADLAGQGSGTGSYYLAGDGYLVGSTSLGTGDALMTGGFAPVPIPIRITTSVTVARID
jgi:hypothetical protein